jgi:molecular chaperone DnaJ
MYKLNSYLKIYSLSSVLKQRNIFRILAYNKFSNFYNKFNIKYFSFFKKSSPKLSKNHNFYEILGVKRNCSNEGIREAYLKLSKHYHPDVNKDLDSEEKFKTLTFAYEALSNERNRDLYDAYNDDPYSQEWKFGEEQFREKHDERASANRFYEEKSKNHKYSQDSCNYQSTSWQSSNNNFEGCAKDFENIFNKGASGFQKNTKEQKSDDILLQIEINIEESFNGTEKMVKFYRNEKCKSCKGSRTAPGHLPSLCFVCSGAGEIRTVMFNSKKCNQCKGLGHIIKHSCK